MAKIFNFFILIGVIATALANYEAELIEQIKQGYAEYLKTGVLPEYYKEAVGKFQLPGLLRDDEISRQEFKKNTEGLQDSALCALCNTFASFLVEERELGMTRVQMLAELTSICVEFGVENERVCEGTIDINMLKFSTSFMSIL